MRTAWATRNITDVLADISIYTGWSKRNSTVTQTMGVDGIFFDESPSEYSADNANFITTVNAAVKSSSGIAQPKLVRGNMSFKEDHLADQFCYEIHW